MECEREFGREGKSPVELLIEFRMSARFCKAFGSVYPFWNKMWMCPSLE